VRYLWAEEEKGFIRTVVGYELVDPKQIGNPILYIYSVDRKIYKYIYL